MPEKILNQIKGLMPKRAVGQGADGMLYPADFAAEWRENAPNRDSTND